jgi:hypothetical protein
MIQTKETLTARRRAKRNGGAVTAELLVLKVPEQEAKDRLWRRETRRIGQGGHYRHSERPGPNTLIIDSYPNFGGVAIALAARFPANIAPLTAHELARLAIAAARETCLNRPRICWTMSKSFSSTQKLSPKHARRTAWPLGLTAPS